jgi:murein DD-endopeptidase MepM/ murein hydrolase activator NlpD
VVRTFPCIPSERVAAGLLAGSLLLAGLVSPVAHGDDLPGRQHRVERRIAGAHQDLDESSAQVRRAASALTSARVRLGAARLRLATTQGQLVAAQALDEEMATRLAAAEERLRVAEADLVAGRRRVVEQEDTLGQIVVADYQTGDPSLLGLSMVLTSQDPTELTGQLKSVQNVMAKESVVLKGLEASRAMLTVQAEEVDAARAEVAQKRREAADNLVRKQSLQAQAQAAETSVHSLVVARATARRQAERARSADLAQLRSLRAEQQRITAVLKRRADAARARAAASAAAAGRRASSGTVLGDGGPVRSNGFLNYPVEGPVTSPFGWRIHPIYGYRSLHDGTDFGAACGTPIRAAAPGRVLEEYFQTAWGNRIIIDHGVHEGVGLATISNHLSSYAVGVGEQVARGQVVGYVGTTGWSTGCHLHFTVMQDGVPVDPMTWF